MQFFANFAAQSTFMVKNVQQDITHIRQMMERSSRYRSLSGLSGVWAGLFGIMAFLWALLALQNHGIDYFSSAHITYTRPLLHEFMWICMFALGGAAFATVYFTRRKARLEGQKPWSSITVRLLTNFMIPLVAGGIFCLAMYAGGHYAFIAPAMLVFYGLAWINAAKYTFSDVAYMGYLELALGLVALFFTHYGLIFWALGFGALHIGYGLFLYKKYR